MSMVKEVDMKAPSCMYATCMGFLWRVRETSASAFVPTARMCTFLMCTNAFEFVNAYFPIVGAVDWREMVPILLQYLNEPSLTSV